METDDSDFYGDEETVASLQARVHSFTVDAPGEQQRQRFYAASRRRTGLVADRAQLHNPYAGVPYAWQLTETVDAFLARLPPKTTPADEHTPCIFICNPYIPREDKPAREAGASKGSEDEAPVEQGSKPGVVAEAGLERLELVASFIEKAQRQAKGASAVEREIGKERQQAVRDILALAHAAKVRAGKWMLFCTSGEVNDVWERVARATASNELGIAAKVAPRPMAEDPRRDQLICVYTLDFMDRADVGRVLRKLRALGLVEARGRGRPIYYKPDAFTYIGIGSANPWGVRASLYSSRDVFPGST